MIHRGYRRRATATYGSGGHRVVPSALMESVLSHGRLRHQLRMESTFSCLRRNGGFWIGDTRGVSHVQGNLIVSHFDLEVPPSRMVEDEDGSLWVTTVHRPSSPGRFVMSRIEK